MVWKYTPVCRTCGWIGQRQDQKVNAEQDGDEHAISIARTF